MLILRLFSLSGKSFFCSTGGCFYTLIIFPFRKKFSGASLLSKPFPKPLRSLTDLSQLLKIFPKPLQNLSKPSQDFLKPLQNLSKTFQNFQNPLRAGLWGVFPAFFMGSGLLQPFQPFVRASEPLSSLFRVSGPLLVLSRLLDLFPAFSGPRHLL